MMPASTTSHPFSTHTNLASASLGTRMLFATDDFFAIAENMLSDVPPQFSPTTFTTFGKEMDGWETRRKRTEGHDWCILKLGLPGYIKGFEIDTGFFTGNQVPKISIQAAEVDTDLYLVRRAELGSCCTAEELQKAEAVGSHKWKEILGQTVLQPGYEATRYHYVAIDDKNSGRWTHLRVNLFPDGGVTRLKAFGVVSRDWRGVSGNEVVDLVSVENGGRAISFSNSHYGHPRNLLAPGRGINMADGWETARNPDRPSIYVKDPATNQLIIPGKHWAILSLGHAGMVRAVEFDTHHFKGNYPESALVEGANIPSSDPAVEISNDKVDWFPLIPRTKLQAHAQAAVEAENKDRPVTHIRVTIFPDGGLSRLRVLGTIC